MASHFSAIQMAPPIEVFHVNGMFLADTHPEKVNLSIGGKNWIRSVLEDLCKNRGLILAYRTDDGKPWVLPVVREAEKRLVEDASQNHEYLPVLGFEPFTKAATEFLLGSAHDAVTDGRVCVSLDVRWILMDLGSSGGSIQALIVNFSDEQCSLQEALPFQTFGVQCLSGTGSLRVGAEFLTRLCGHKIAYMSKPSWGKPCLNLRDHVISTWLYEWILH